ncbi:MAG: TetR/AcrR family transcriptional regulator [Methylococcaceae bacterium]|nr:TetR/AcrR family transcriptional regulator [Methylococcaceae bacterium]
MDQEIQKDKEELHNDILVAALKLFTEKGYFNTSLTDIAELSGVKTSAAIYKHFKNKQEIAQALYEWVLDRLSVSIDDIRRRNRKASEQLREIVDLWFHLADHAPEIMKFLLVLNISEFLPEEKPLMETAPFSKILRILQNGIKDGEIKALDAQRAYCHFFGIIESTLKQVVMGNLTKKADYYQSDAWLSAWSTIVKK